MESKTSIGHYLEAVPLTADERAIVEGDLAKLDGLGLIRKLDDVPTLDGRTPSQIEAKKIDNHGRPNSAFVLIPFVRNEM
ncbi:site-specific recombinase [Pseudomonas syringae]|uniref:site-specific recombinase n=1 Tax=Pseudomonas syringae TaxID=317 RepID=UPI001E56A97B|nr:site-specific recombinase [Pseudomonas syringae]